MLKKQIKTYSLLVIGLISVILSIIIFNEGRDILKILTYLISGVLILSGISNLISTIFRKNELKLFDAIIKSSINISFGLITIVFNNYILASITLIFSLYMLLIALINLISYLIFKVNNVSGRMNSLINFIVSIIFAFILIINPYMNLKYVLIYLSVYLLLFGIKNILNFVILIIPSKYKKNIELPLPAIMSLILPKALILEINEMLEVNNQSNFNSEIHDKTPSLFVIIHLAKTGSSSFGHMEVAYENKIYSYGNYNRHSRKLFDSIGDGILLIADKEKYINYCINNKKRYLIEFGISLTEKQKVDVEKRIDKLINTNTVDYYPDLELYDKGLIAKTDFKDMSSELYKYAGAKFKKIISGKNKTFFALKNNCAYVAEQILKGSGKKILSIDGITSPGVYYDYLNSAFLLKNTNVVTRKLYVEDNYARITRSGNSKRNTKKTNSKSRD